MSKAMPRTRIVTVRGFVVMAAGLAAVGLVLATVRDEPFAGRFAAFGLALAIACSHLVANRIVPAWPSRGPVAPPCPHGGDLVPLAIVPIGVVLLPTAKPRADCRGEGPAGKGTKPVPWDDELI